ncbi:hypothetical protein GCM10022226_57130 [Sphaerisporangium flaviroseum]|uniref:Uncharacterized protein n=1 Tax=Sphaerisporangium flaviroseum TaxID=509199 RepID=A0ABP7IXH3_9ACTN
MAVSIVHAPETYARSKEGFGSPLIRHALADDKIDIRFDPLSLERLPDQADHHGGHRVVPISISGRRRAGRESS